MDSVREYSAYFFILLFIPTVSSLLINATMTEFLNTINERIKNEADAIVQDLADVGGKLPVVDVCASPIDNNITAISTRINALGITLGFGKPSFISEWFPMKAQDPSLSSKTIAHGLGTIPYKVEIQIQFSEGPNSDWIFHGDSAIQSDDGTDSPYGGVQYLYDDTNVYLFTPKQTHNFDKGTLVYTGQGTRIGCDHQSTDEAFVRVKAYSANWRQPDFQTEWLPLDILNSALTFQEVHHNFGVYPEFVNVQVRCTGTGYDYISEGTGSAQEAVDGAYSGGTVWGYNDKTVRIWTSYKPVLERDPAHPRYNTGGLIGGFDGWSFATPFTCWQGTARVIAWSENDAVETYFERKENIFFTETQAGHRVDADNDLLSAFVEANDGANQGYRFPGRGNSQNQHSPFGGSLFAFRGDGSVRTWVPDTRGIAYNVLIQAPYGAGLNSQMSNNASCVISLLKG